MPDEVIQEEEVQEEAPAQEELVSEESIAASMDDDAEEPEAEEPQEEEGEDEGSEDDEPEGAATGAPPEGQEGATEEAPAEGVAAAPTAFVNRISYLERELRRSQERQSQFQQFFRQLFEQAATPEERATMHQQEAEQLRRQQEYQAAAAAATQQLDHMESTYETQHPGFGKRCRAYEKQRIRALKENGLEEAAAYQMMSQELAAVGGSARARGEDPIAAIDRYVTGNTRTGKPKASKKAAIAAREDRAAARKAASATAPTGTSGGSISDPIAKFLKSDMSHGALVRLFKEVKGRQPQESGELSEFRFEVLESVVR